MNDRKRVGLALGGGVVRGLAHVGVLSVLEQAGIQVDYIAGTSAGAIVAAAYASGMKARQLEEWGARMSWRRLARPAWPVRGFISFAPLARWLRQEFGDPDFSDLAIPCAIVAADLERGEPVCLEHGKVIPAVHASCCVPGFVEPIRLDGRLLGDACIVDMLPVNVLRTMGADYVIAVDVFAFKVRRWLGPFGYMLAGLETLLERAGGGITAADCLISPALEGATYLRFSKRRQLVELGRLAAQGQLETLRRDLQPGSRPTDPSNASQPAGFRLIEAKQLP